MSDKAKIIIALISIVIALSAFYFSYTKGVQSGHAQYQQDRMIISQLNETIKNLEDDLDASEEKMIFAQRQQQIQEEAYKQMSNAYSASEQKNQYLGSRLDFYRSIISPESGQSGPTIQGLEYRVEQDAINFDVVLVQAIKHKHQVRGALSVELYSGDNLISKWPETNARSVSYQYFQQVSGSIAVSELPQNARMKVILMLKDNQPIEKWFDVG